MENVHQRTLLRVKRQPIGCEKIFGYHLSHKRICVLGVKNLQLNNKKRNNKNRQMILINISLWKIYKWSVKHMKRRSGSLVIRKILSKSQ